MRRLRWGAIALAGMFTSASAQDAAPAQEPREEAQLQAEADVADRCVALLRGEALADSELIGQCENLVRAGVEPGIGRAGADPGESVRAAFTQAGRELTGRGPPGIGLGATVRGPVRSTLMTNPIGWFSGLGVNAEYSRPFDFNRLSWVAAARYARANASNGEITTLGAGAGLDFYIIGRNNEGLRIGPRIEFAFGSENIGGRTNFGRIGASGEIGYNFIASNGLTASAAGGLGARLAGDEQNENFQAFTGGEFGPYVKLGLGYSW
jgi:hypothetical protein